MKMTCNHIAMKSLCRSLVLAIALLELVATPAWAQETGSAKGGAMKLLEPAKSKQELAKAKPGDTVAVACPHCEAVWVSTVPQKGAEQLVTFQGEDKVKCPKCGISEAFCCVGKAEK